MVERKGLTDAAQQVVADVLLAAEDRLVRSGNESAFWIVSHWLNELFIQWGWAAEWPTKGE